MHGPLRYRLDPVRITVKLSCVAFLLLVCQVVGAYLWANGSFLGIEGPDAVDYKYIEMFDLDEEKSFGTWFAAVILLFAGRLLLVVARDSREGKDGFFGWWIVLAAGFHFLSIDEVAGMHEYLNSYGDEIGLNENWTTYAMIVVLGVATAYIPFLILMAKRGHGRLVFLLLAAGFIYVGGAVGAEYFSPSRSDFATRAEFKVALNSLTYNMGWITLEEGMEMTGVILFIYTLLDYLRGGPKRRTMVDVYNEEPGATLF